MFIRVNWNSPNHLLLYVRYCVVGDGAAASTPSLLPEGAWRSEREKSWEPSFFMPERRHEFPLLAMARTAAGVF